MVDRVRTASVRLRLDRFLGLGLGDDLDHGAGALDSGDSYLAKWGCAAVAGDLDGDGIVGLADFLVLLDAWGPCPQPCPPSCPADLDGDCAVGIVDFLTLLFNWD